MPSNALVAICLHIALLSSVCDSSQFPFTSEVLMEHLQLIDKFFTYCCENIARRYCAICLHADEELGNVGVSD